MPLHDVPHLEHRIATLQPQCLGLLGQRHDDAIVRSRHAHRLMPQSRAEHTLHGAEEIVAIDKCEHWALGFSV